MYYNRKSVRLKSYDYSKPGIYYITICADRFKHHFGLIKTNRMTYTAQGKIALKFWLKIPNHFQIVSLDAFIIMPDHIHGIIIIEDQAKQRRDTACRVPTYEKYGQPTIGSIPTIIRSYKSAVTRWCHKNGHPKFKWQSCYHEHIVRNQNELNAIRKYIINNPRKWCNE